MASEPRLQLRWTQGAVLAAFVGAVGAAAFLLGKRGPKAATLQADGDIRSQHAVDAAEAERCMVPDFDKTTGHEQRWKLHNNCL